MSIDVSLKRLIIDKNNDDIAVILLLWVYEDILNKSGSVSCFFWSLLTGWLVRDLVQDGELSHARSIKILHIIDSYMDGVINAGTELLKNNLNALTD